MSTLPLTAPSDRQLWTINRMCRERGYDPPDAVASMAEASEIITRLTHGAYRPEDFAYPWHDYSQEVPF